MLLGGEVDRRWQAEDARSVERGVDEQKKKITTKSKICCATAGEKPRSSTMHKITAVATRIQVSGDKKRAASIYDVNVKL